MSGRLPGLCGEPAVLLLLTKLSVELGCIQVLAFEVAGAVMCSLQKMCRTPSMAPLWFAPGFGATPGPPPLTETASVPSFDTWPSVA
jgi:hypothetical protein